MALPTNPGEILKNPHFRRTDEVTVGILDALRRTGAHHR